MRQFSLALIAGVLGLAFTSNAQAQPFFPRSQGHNDYVPGHFERHRGHVDYVPGHYDYHRGGHGGLGYGSGSGYSTNTPGSYSTYNYPQSVPYSPTYPGSYGSYGPYAPPSTHRHGHHGHRGW